LNKFCKVCPQSAICIVWGKNPLFFQETITVRQPVEPRHDAEIAWVCYPPIGGGAEYDGALKVFRVDKREWG